VLTQPVLLQSFQDEFDLPAEDYATPAAPNSVLLEGAKDEEMLGPNEQATYRKGVGKLLHLARWSRPDIFNAVRECSRYGGRATKRHMDQMLRIMKHCVNTLTLGWMMSPDRKWSGEPTHNFVITGLSDSDYAKDPKTRRSVSGRVVKLEGSVINCKSKMMPTVALSVTEAELFAATACVQDMLYAKRIIESLGLKVKLPMILEVDNKGAKDLVNNWSVGGRTRHVEVKQYFLRDLKEEGLIVVKWVPTSEMTADIFTKNLGGLLYEKHSRDIVGSSEE
jgi:hypothetical protein